MRNFTKCYKYFSVQTTNRPFWRTLLETLDDYIYATGAHIHKWNTFFVWFSYFCWHPTLDKGFILDADIVLQDVGYCSYFVCIFGCQVLNGHFFLPPDWVCWIINNCVLSNLIRQFSTAPFRYELNEKKKNLMIYHQQPMIAKSCSPVGFWETQCNRTIWILLLTPLLTTIANF